MGSFLRGHLSCRNSAVAYNNEGTTLSSLRKREEAQQASEKAHQLGYNSLPFEVFFSDSNSRTHSVNLAQKHIKAQCSTRELIVIPIANHRNQWAPVDKTARNEFHKASQ